MTESKRVNNCSGYKLVKIPTKNHHKEGSKHVTVTVDSELILSGKEMARELSRVVDIFGHGNTFLIRSPFQSLVWIPDIVNSKLWSCKAYAFVTFWLITAADAVSTVSITQEALQRKTGPILSPFVG